MTQDKVVAKVIAAVVDPFPATSASIHAQTHAPNDASSAESSEYETSIAAKAAAAADADLLAAADIDLFAECGQTSIVDSPMTQVRKKRESWLETKTYSNDADSLTFCVALKEPLCASGEKFGEESESRSRRRSNRSLNFQQPSIAAEVVGWCSVILLVGLVAMDRSALTGDWAAQLGEFFNHFGN